MNTTRTLKKIKKLTSFETEIGFANLDHSEAVDLIQYINRLAEKAIKENKK